MQGTKWKRLCEPTTGRDQGQAAIDGNEDSGVHGKLGYAKSSPAQEGALAGAASNPASWHTAYDCDWNNRTPSWDVPGTLDDPSLDRDDIPGKGPENIRINQPSTAHPYTIGVHMFSWLASPSTVTATLKVYCAGALKTTLTKSFNSIGTMWIAGAVSFPGPGGCTRRVLRLACIGIRAASVCLVRTGRP